MQVPHLVSNVITRLIGKVTIGPPAGTVESAVICPRTVLHGEGNKVRDKTIIINLLVVVVEARGITEVVHMLLLVSPRMSKKTEEGNHTCHPGNCVY